MRFAQSRLITVFEGWRATRRILKNEAGGAHSTTGEIDDAFQAGCGARVGGLDRGVGDDRPLRPTIGFDRPRDDKPPTSYMPVVPNESFESVVKRLVADKPNVEQRHARLLEERYDLGDHPAKGVVMSRGKAVQGGVRVKLPQGTSWDKLAQMSPADIRKNGAGLKDSCRCPTLITPREDKYIRSSTSTRSRNKKIAT